MTSTTPLGVLVRFLLWVFVWLGAWHAAEVIAWRIRYLYLWGGQ